MDATVGDLFAAFLVGTVGLGLFVYGKKQVRVPQLVTGLALMAFPYFVTSALAIAGVTALLLGGLWLALRYGA